MPLMIMRGLDLKKTRGYLNTCTIESKKVKLYGVVANQIVSLEGYPEIETTINILIVDISIEWGNLLKIF